MSEVAEPLPTFLELMGAFKAALRSALGDGEIPTESPLHPAIMQAVENVAHAENEGGASDELIATAYRTFAEYAARQAPPRSTDAL